MFLNESVSLPLPTTTSWRRFKSGPMWGRAGHRSHKKLMAREATAYSTSFVPKTIEWPQATSSLSLNQLWAHFREETSGFVSLRSLEHNVHADVTPRIKEKDSSRDKRRRWLSADEHLKVIRARLIEKQNVCRISSELEVSTSLVYAVLKSYRDKGIGPLITKKSKKTIGNN